MRTSVRGDGVRLRALLASSSVAALLIGGGVPAAYAASCTNVVTAPYDNPAGHTVTNICVSSATTGNITNEGNVSPNGIAFVGGKLSGELSSTGTISGGISLDANSDIVSAHTAMQISGAALIGGISNAGIVNGNSRGIYIDTLATFGGGISNSGHIESDGVALQITQVPSFSGAIVNSAAGVISSTHTAILISNNTTIGGGIANLGTIAGKTAISLVSGSVSGGIGDGGIISATNHGISIDHNSAVSGDTAILVTGPSFTGGISNAGTLSASNFGGILVAGTAIAILTTFSGGVTNAGVISGGASFGIGVVNDVLGFSGGIVNSASGRITGVANGIYVGGADLFFGGVSQFSNGIQNAGYISAATNGIFVGGQTPARGIGLSKFSGGITNTGTISAGVDGIYVDAARSFSGGIVNSATGTIGAVVGIEVADGSRFDGGITNSGAISASIQDIFVQGQSVFSGGITNAGTLVATGGTGVGVQVYDVDTFQGVISNSGTISANSGILVEGVGTFQGGIVNSSTGTIAGGNRGIYVSSVSVFGSKSAAGGITNAGNISATHIGIGVSSVSTFYGGVTNSGTIAASYAISVSAQTFMGGITNSGSITAVVGILVPYAQSFSGGIVNAATGTIGAFGDGIRVGVTAGGVGGVSAFSGGITNAGTITAGFSGIFVGGVTTVSGGVGVSSFSGGITNSGTIVAGDGIVVGTLGLADGVSSFGGNISNSGLISASGNLGSRGIFVSGVSTFSGAVINSGTISAGNTGISVVNFGTVSGGILNKGNIFAGGTGVLVEGTSFANGISNSGTISAGYTGIAVGVSTFTGGITNSGAITAPNGTGIIVFSAQTFAGGIVNAATGTIAVGFNGIDVGPNFNGVGGVSAFSGGITNAGRITAGSAGIFVGGATSGGSVGVSSFSGNISNSGTIRGENGIVVGAYPGVGAGGLSIFGGSISNNGLVSAGTFGVVVSNVATFADGISNSGTITAGHTGIVVASVQTFSGGIVNALGGTITAGDVGIRVGPTPTAGGAVTAFSGGISNAGMITASTGIFVGGATGISNGVGVSTFSGGISNSGTISADFGILVGFTGIGGGGVSTFSGGVTNSGMITMSGGNGIDIQGVSTFAGSIVNSGGATISGGQRGIYVTDVAQFGNSAGGGVTNNGMISATRDGISIGRFVTVFSGGITNTATIIGGYSAVDVRAKTFSGLISNTGLIWANYNADPALAVGGTTSGARFMTTFSGGIFNGGTISSVGSGIQIRSVATFSGGISNSGTISAASVGIELTAPSLGTAISTFSGNISNAGLIVGNTGVVIGTFVTFAAGSAIVNSGNITGTGGVAIDASNATSPVTIDQVSGTISGAIDLSAHADVFNVSGGSILGDIVGQGISNTVNFEPGSGNAFTYNYDFTGVHQVNVDSGTVVLNGSANSATFVDVNGGTLAGIGAITATTVTIHSGATFAPGSGVPGTSMSITGSLVFQTAATYMVQLNSTSTSFATVNGTATLAGTVSAQFAPGSTALLQYDILHTTAGLGGTRFNALTVNNASPNYTPSLTYSATDVYLTQTPNLGKGGGLNQNQQSVASGINNAYINAGSLPPAFLDLYGLTGTRLDNALSQLSGEDATGGERDAFLLMDDFLNLMLDPNVDGRNGGLGSPVSPGLGLQASVDAPAALAFDGPTDGPPELTPDDVQAPGGPLPPPPRLGVPGANAPLPTGAMAPLAPAPPPVMPGAIPAFPAADAIPTFGLPSGAAPSAQPPAGVAVVPAQAIPAAPPPPPPTAVTFAQRWSTWGSGFGGYSQTAGDATVGSHTLTDNVYGFAGGLDYRASPLVVLGFALSGASTNWGLASGLGSGRSDAFQVGAHAKIQNGNLYFAAAGAFANHWMTTSRIAYAGENLNGSFTAQDFGGRIETGARFNVTARAGITPYLAGQGQLYRMPSFDEAGSAADAYALSYSDRLAYDMRTEIGARWDILAFAGATPVVLRGRLAWAHDWESDPLLQATFQSLPAATFTVNGATPPSNSALASAAAQIWLTPSWSLTGKFYGEFASGAQSYAGDGTLRYTW